MSALMGGEVGFSDREREERQVSSKIYLTLSSEVTLPL